MFARIKVLSVISCLALGLQACGDDDPSTANAPRQLVNVNTAVYSAIRQNPAANALFQSAGAANPGDEPCDVKVHRMRYNTVGGAGESATSSGVFMLPHGDDPRCSGPRPVVLYAHGTVTEKNYDLSQLVTDPTNPASAESLLLLAAYAANGYAVIAPNYAGYSDSSLSYHPYVDEKQQTTEMLNALDHAREYVGMLGGAFSSELFVSGMSQGGYVSMATHKALEQVGEKVTGSVNMSGPYAMLDFVDAVMAGYVNYGSTVFAPLFMTALDKAYDVYDQPNEIYTEAYAGIAETAFPTQGGFEASGMPVALFGGQPPADANPINAAGFGDDHLFNDAFRLAYLGDIQANGRNPQNKVRAAVKDLDLRDWQPAAPLMMCGAGNDPVVYHFNADLMAAYWADLVSVGLVSNLDLTDTPAGPFAPIMGAYQQAGIEPLSVHGATASYCTLAALGYFNQLRAVAN